MAGAKFLEITWSQGDLAPPTLISAIQAVHRDDSGRVHLQLRERDERLPVSHLYAQLFSSDVLSEQPYARAARKA
jgi:hypothetical protein